VTETRQGTGKSRPRFFGVANPEVEQAAREAMGELGADAVAFLIERAELADAISSSAATWRELAEAASRMRPHG
jgi:hypothetical protein